tara:strand:+ start:440 stop:598 length:159 start_codon:yes stop_codon:yes gene_type:complete
MSSPGSKQPINRNKTIRYAFPTILDFIYSLVDVNLFRMILKYPFCHQIKNKN